VKTDDRATRQRDEVEGDEAKVVRLSDWLGPDDELVPFGPRAHAQAAAREPAARSAGADTVAEPPEASGFWDGDTSVHTAVPGPGIFDEPGERTTDRRRDGRAVPVWRPALPPLHSFGWGSRMRERLADLDRISWRWAAAGVAFVSLALAVLVITLGGGSSGRHDTVAQAGIGDSAPPGLNATLGDIGTATRMAAVSNLRRLPPVNTTGRTIGTAALHARALQARPRHHAVIAPASVPSSSATESVETTTAASSPAEATTAPTETAPTQTTSNSSPTTGGGGSSGGDTSDGNASSGSHQSAFGPGGSLGPGSSPNG
jgi:hypothetical protein